MAQSTPKTIKEWFPFVCGTFYLAGIAGFIYETIFYLINNGVLTRRGTTFGPWIQIYAYGGVMLLVFLYRLRKSKLAIFLLSGLLAGILEYAVGFFIYYTMDGFRPWDYNTEIWNWGNIDGFVCFRSVFVFALGGLLLTYGVIPFFMKLRDTMKPAAFRAMMYIPAAICAIDIFYNDVLAKIFPIMDAYQFYLSTGWYGIVSR